MTFADQQFERIAKSVFGPDARLSGSVGSARYPGDLTIRLDGRILGSARTFQAALAKSMVRASILFRPDRV